MTGTNGTTLDFELFFLSEVLKMTSFHYGYWDPVPECDRMSLDDLRCAQERYTRELISMIPQGVTSVLDVGAGTGAASRALALHGYEVVAISPDENHRKYFCGRTDPGLRFHCSRFEDFETPSRFDLLYFSESINYIDVDEGLCRSRRLAKPGGHLLISGTFRAPDDLPFGDDFDLSRLEYVERARAMGFQLVTALDITENVRPTVRLAHRALDDFVPPLLRMAEAYAETKPGLRRLAANWLLERPRRELLRAIGHYRRETDPEYFGPHMRYATLLLRVPV